MVLFIIKPSCLHSDKNTKSRRHSIKQAHVASRVSFLRRSIKETEASITSVGDFLVYLPKTRFSQFPRQNKKETSKR